MSDNESEQSLPEVLSSAQMAEFDEGDLLNRNRDFENDNNERRFSEMSRQISELLTLCYHILKSYPLIQEKGTA